MSIVALGHSASRIVAGGGSVVVNSDGTITVTGDTSFGASPATAGRIRLPNNQSIQARNAADSANIGLLSLNGSNQVVIGQTGVTLSSPGPLNLNGALDLGNQAISNINSLVIGAATPTGGYSFDVRGAGIFLGSSTTLLNVARLSGTPALQVDTNTLSSVTGLKITAAATGNGVALAALSDVANDKLTLDAKGTGTISIGTISTGAITLGQATTITTGGLTVSAGGATITGSLNMLGTNVSLLISTINTGIALRSGGYCSVGSQYSSGHSVFGGNVMVNTNDVNQIQSINTGVFGGQAIQMVLNGAMLFHVATGSVTAGAAFSAQRMSLSTTALTLSDAIDLAVGTTTGTKIGTATAQKIGVYGVTPIIQGAAVADASGGATVDAEARTALNALLARIRAFGIIAT